MPDAAMNHPNLPLAEKAPEQGDAGARCSVAVDSASGPSYCNLCGEWPARQTANGLRCHLCECRDICADNPVPLPDGRECLQDLASIGVPGAPEKLTLLPNAEVSEGGTLDSRVETAAQNPPFAALTGSTFNANQH